MVNRQKNITVFIKLYGGLDRLAGDYDYDPEIGIEVSLKAGARIKKALKIIGLKRRGAIAFFINGKKAELHDRLSHNDVIFCMKPVTGG